MPRALIVLLLVVLAGTAAAAPSAPPSAPQPVAQCAPGLGIGLLEVPRATAKDPRARNYVIDAVKPGADFTRAFQVCNGTDKPLPVELYADSATIDRGSFVLAPGRGASELTSWMTVTPASLVVPPGRAVKAQVRFTVPLDASPGEVYGGIVADSPAIASGGIAVGGRVGIRVYLSVAPGGLPKSDFTIDSLQAVRGADGRPAVLAQVHNTGARALDMGGSLALSDGPAGLAAGPFDAKVGTTLKPGDTAPVTVPLDKAISGGPWHAVITMKSGLLERRAAADLTFPDQSGAETVPVKAVPLYKDKGVVIPLAVVLLSIVGLLLLLFLAWQLLRRRRVGSAA